MTLDFRNGWVVASVVACLSAPSAFAQTDPAPTPRAVTIACTSKPGERNHCAADTSRGVVLARSHGEAPCLLGRSWGYDDRGRLGLGRLQRRVHRSAVRLAAGAPEEQKKQKPLEYIPNAGFLLYDGDKGQIYMRLFTYVRYLNQKGLDPTYVDAFGNTKTRAAAPGRPAQQVLPALQRLVPDPEVPLLPVRLVVERLAGRSRAGGGRRQHQLRVQPVRDARRRHHQPSRRAQHRGPVPLLARHRRPPDVGRVLPPLLHHRLLAQGRAHHEAQVHGHDRQQPEHARRERRAARQRAQHHVLDAAVAAHDGRVRPLRHVRRLRPPREAGHAAGRPLHAQPRGQAEPARHRRHREQPDPAHRRQRHLHARPVRPGHHRREGDLRHGEHRRRHQVQGPVAGGRVLLALAERLHRAPTPAGSRTSTTTGSRCSPRPWRCGTCCRCT